MTDEPSLNFKFTIDVSDIDKAKDKISSALASIEVDAQNQGKNADLAMAKFLQELIEERERAVESLSQQLEQATKDVAIAFANMQQGVEGSGEAYDKATDKMKELQDSIAQTKKELELLDEKQVEVASNASFMSQLRMLTQQMDVYGKVMALLPAPIANIVKSTKLLDGALKLLSTNPIIMVIAGIIIAMKALSGYADMMANKFEAWAVIFGTITEAVRKFKEVITAIITLDWKDFVYNLTTMFDGGAREIQKRNEQLAQSERQVENEKLKAEIQVLNKRASNRKRSFDERIKAQKEANDKELKILQNGLDDQAQAMRDFYIDNNLYHPEWNPKGLKTSEEEIDTAQRSQLNKLNADRMRLQAQIVAQQGINEENLHKLNQQRSDEWSKEVDRQLQQIEKDIEAYRKKRDYQRQVREALEAEAERLQAMSAQTGNMVIQSQIKEMADGIEKVTKEAQFKTKLAYEALDKTLVDEAKKLYNNEKAIYEGNPANEGKLFKAFKLDDYVRQARQNIGYNLRKELISNEEMQTMKKAVDKLVKDTTDNIKKSTDEASDALTKLRESMEVKKDDNLFRSIKSEVIAYQKALTSFKNTYDEASESERELAELQKERIMLQIQLNEAEEPKEKEKIAEAIKKNIDKSNEASQKAIGIADKLKKKQEDVKKTIEEQRQALIGYLEQITSVFKGISDDADKAMEMTSQMLDAMKSIASGNYIEGAVKVMTMMLEKITDSIKRRKKMEEERMEKEKESLKAQSDSMRALTQSAFDYKLALLDAKKAQDALYNTTNIQSMLDAQKKLNDAQKMYLEYGDTLTSGSGLRNRGTWSGLEGFVNSVNSTVIGGARAIREGAIKHFADTLEAPLFKLNEKGVYEVDKEVWGSIKSSGDAISVLNEEQQQTIENLIALQDKIAEAQEEMAGSIAEWYAPLLDNMTDAMMDWLTTNEDIMDKFREYSSDTFRQIVKDLIKNLLYKDLFSEYTTQIESMTKEYLNTGNEQNYAQAIASVTNSLMEDMEDAKAKSKAIWDAWESSMNEIGIDMNETTGRNAEARGIARASQESVDENNARLAMMQQHTYSINANVAQLVSYSASALEHLSAIHMNTNRLERIEGLLSDINTYGVRTR